MDVATREDLEVELVETTSTNGSSASGSPSFVRVYGQWILAITLAVLAVTFFMTERKTPTYASSARVVVEPRVFPGGSPAQEPDMPTEQAVASSSVVNSIAAEALKLNPGELAPGLSVSVPVDAHVLDFSYSFHSPAEAQRRAGAFAQAYVDYLNRQGIREPNSVYLKPPPAGLVQAEVVSPATLPSAPSGPNLPLNLVLGGVVGLVLGFGTALLRNRGDRRCRSIDEVVQQTGFPVLGAISSASRRPLDAPASRGGVVSSESFRYLRAKVERNLLPNGRGTLLVTSAGNGEGKTTAALGLAESFASSGCRVAVVEGDLRGGDLGERLGLPLGSAGLTTVLSGQADLADSLQETSVPGLWLLARGRAVPAAGDLLAGAGLAQLMSRLLEMVDLVIIDAPSILSNADAVTWLRVTDATLLVVDSAHTSRQMLAETAGEIQWAGGVAVAVVVNDVARRRSDRLLRPLGRSTAARGRDSSAPGRLRPVPVGAPGRAPGEHAP